MTMRTEVKVTIFQCLWVTYYITSLTENELPTAKDIPLNAATYDLLEMIDQVCIHAI